MSFFGKIAYSLYFAPKAKLKSVQKQGGIINTININNGKKAMQIASEKLSVLPITSDSKPFQIHYLTGKKFWYQTAFCAYSLAKVSNLPIQFVFHDDGTFDAELKEQAQIQFPNCIIHGIEEINAMNAQFLPASKYPFLNKKRIVYPHIRKLTDVHGNSSGWKLLLDSDMLFFKKPSFMLDWLSNPERPFFMLDCQNAYHYSFDLMKKLTGHSIVEKLNVGSIGLKSETIDWDKLEYWAKTMEDAEGSSYYLEQALSAMIVAGQPLTLAPLEEYVVLPSKNEVLHPSVTLHHYVAESKEWYLKQGWKHIFKQ